MREHVTINQIARESRVSISTVSRVLNGTAAVTPETRERVEAVIKKYHFSPNAMARGLIFRQSMTLGVIVPDISNPYFSAMFSEIEQSALDAGYSVLLCNTLFGSVSNKRSSVKSEEEYFQMMIDKQVDGVLIMGGQIDLCNSSASYQDALKRLARQVPTVVIGRAIPGMEEDCLFIERESCSGVVTAVNYLVSLGHRRIAFAGGEPGVTITESRLGAYRSALSANGLPGGEELVALTDYYTADGYAAAMELMNRKALFTALLAINDNVAFGVQRALADRGLSVPEDVAIISCDQFYSADYLIPRLTSIDQHNEMFGKMVIQVLLCKIKGVGEPVRLSFTPELIVRESCGARLGTRNFPD